MAGGIVNTHYTNIFGFVNPKTEITSKKLHDVASLVNRQSTGCKGGSGGVRLYVHHTKTFAGKNPRHGEFDVSLKNGSDSLSALLEAASAHVPKQPYLK